MINITLEQIDTIMQRANVSYSEAKAALEETNGDVLEALLKLEAATKIKDNPTSQKEHSGKIKSFIRTLNKSSFIIKKDNKTHIDLPLAFALLFILLCLPFSLIGILISIILGYKVSIDDQDIIEKVNSTISH